MAVLLLAVFIAACSVRGNMDEVDIDHPANQFAIAQAAAEGHCDKHGRTAKHLRTGPAKASSILFLRSRTSTFECVTP